MPKIQVENLYKVFGAKSEKAIAMLRDGAGKKEVMEKLGVNVGVSNASFTIHEKEIFVIMGLSGSGKSTLLRLINRLIEPSAGKVLVGGKDVTAMSQKELRTLRQDNMSMVFQNFGLFPHRSVLENVAYPLSIRGLDKDLIEKKAQAAVQTVGLAGYEAYYPDELSGGMQQRVGLARALAGDAEILLMDEAFSALDPLIRKDMQDELLELQESMEKTIVFITHDLNEALKLGNRIAIMRDGEVIQVGTPEEILTDPVNTYVERFTEDAVISRVITVRQIMKEPYTVRIDRGPRFALKLMNQYGVSDLFVINAKREVLGLVSAQEMIRARDAGEDIGAHMETDVPTLSPEDILEDTVMVAAETRRPIAVVENNRLIGAAIKGAILGGMTGSYDYNDEEAYKDSNEGFYDDAAVTVVRPEGGEADVSVWNS